MAANPPLVMGYGGALMPAPFAGEFFVLGRDNMQIDVDNVRTRSGHWKADGSLYMSQIRLVFVAKKPDASGLQSFDFPLAYFTEEKFNQPIFGCNNLSMRCFQVGEAGGPRGSLPPHKIKLYLMRGGANTLLPLLWRTLDMKRREAAAQEAAMQAASYPDVNHDASNRPFRANDHDLMGRQNLQAMVDTAYINPNDPSVVYVTQPLGEDKVMAQDKMPYEPTGLKP